MRAHEIMTRGVVTARPTMKVAEIANLMVEHRVSALPVVDDAGTLAGIVTESDLLHRRETGTERKRSWWLDMFIDEHTRSREFVKAHGLYVSDVMTRVVVTVPEDAALAEVADVLDAHRIRRVPVVKGGKVVGIISRRDLVAALARSRVEGAGERIDNGELHKRIYDAIQKQSWVNTLYMNYTVSEGVVRLSGFVDSVDQKRAIKVMVEQIPGVRQVVDELRLRTWQVAS